MPRATSIQFVSGLGTAVAAFTPLDAEPVWSKDAKILWIGQGGVLYQINGGLTVTYTNPADGTVFVFTDGRLTGLLIGGLSGLRAIHSETLVGSGGAYE